MIDYPVTLTPSGGVVLPGHASALALGYTKNKGVYRLRRIRRVAGPDHPGLLAPAGWRGTGVHTGAERHRGCACQRDPDDRQRLRDL